MSAYEFTISLRIRHPTIDPATISATLGLEPQHTWLAGQARCDPGGAELGGTYRDSYWMGRLMAEPQLSSDGVSVEAVVLKTLNNLRRVQSFLEQLHAESGVAELLVEPLRARGLQARAPLGLPDVARPAASDDHPRRSSSFISQGAGVASELTSPGSGGSAKAA